MDTKPNSLINYNFFQYGVLRFIISWIMLRIVQKISIKSLSGQITIDASMCLYQFLIAVRQQDSGMQLNNAEGETTSHLMGFFYRTLRLCDNGIKPVYVFDGKPPELKSGRLTREEPKEMKLKKKLKLQTS